jgi:hypothetical protein
LLLSKTWGLYESEKVKDPATFVTEQHPNRMGIEQLVLIKAK